MVNLRWNGKFIEEIHAGGVEEHITFPALFRIRHNYSFDADIEIVSFCHI